VSACLGELVKHRRISNSPLIDPAISALIIMASAPPDPFSEADGPSRTLATLAQAAAVMGVPVFVLMRCAKQHDHVDPPPQSGKRLPRQFLFEEHCCPWSDAAFVAALAHEDRSILLIGGSWLEHHVLGTALHGLAEGYDVFVLLDATAPCSEHAAQPARERLAQAGGTPVVASQVIHEWMMQAADTAQRTALQDLLSTIRPENPILERSRVKHPAE
jgi:hypothetical protein